MDHSMHAMDMGHGGHGDMDMGPKCKMNMLFTWSTEDLCIVFPQWHISGPWSLLFSLIAIVLLTAGYEAVRQSAQSFEAKQLGIRKDGVLSPTETGNFTPYRDNPAARCDPEVATETPHGDQRDEENGTCNANTVQTAVTNDSQPGPASNRTGNVNERQRRHVKMILAAFYAVQVSYSFFIMLLFMTYNGWVMLSVAVGAFIGYLSFGGGSATRTVACH